MMWIGESPSDLEKLARIYATMHPDLAEQIGIPTYRQTGNLGDWYMRRGHLLVEGWRYNPEELRRQEEEIRKEQIETVKHYFGRITQTFRKIFKK